MSKTTLLRPRLSEKTFVLGKALNVYVFDVPGEANKHTVAAAVAAQFDVVVSAVNITNIKGKTKRLIRKGGRPVMGKRSDLKKAYVTLAEGQHLPFFDEPEEAKKADKKADKPAKKAEKETK
jgi:large subunit ribosomal protein L23